MCLTTARQKTMMLVDAEAVAVGAAERQGGKPMVISHSHQARMAVIISHHNHDRGPPQRFVPRPPPPTGLELPACQPASLTSARQQADSRRTNSHLHWLHHSMAPPPRALRAALHHAMMHTTARPPWSSMSLQYPRPPLHVSLWALACTRPQIAPLERHAGHQANERPSRRPHSLAASSPATIHTSAQVRERSRSRPPAWHKASARAASARPPALFPHGFDASSSTRRHTRWLASVGSATALARGHSPEWPRWT